LFHPASSGALVRFEEVSAVDGLLLAEVIAQGCDATMLNICTKAGYKKNLFTIALRHSFLFCNLKLAKQIAVTKILFSPVSYP
jgi:hypothetical protein